MIMFGFFKSDPTKKLQGQYDKMLEQAVNAQRKGDMRLFAELTSQAEQLSSKIDAIKKEQEANK
jgi:molybdenum-dependent DNA-binding transcriptional regulator ModE